jgi:hypothetical protein
MTYPTIRKVDIGRWESEEGVDGVPDYTIERSGLGHVVLKRRTSSQAKVFRTVTEAKADIADELEDTYNIRPLLRFKAHRGRNT